MIYVCSDNNKCLGCSGANALLYPVESAKAQRRCLYSIVCLRKLSENARPQINGGRLCREFLHDYSLICLISKLKDIGEIGYFLSFSHLKTTSSKPTVPWEETGIVS